jgi:hypothetical protein
MIELERNFAELGHKFDKLSEDYEKRFITSLTVLSGAGFVSLISFSQSFEFPTEFLSKMLPSLWFFLALSFSGTLPMLLSLRFKYLRDHFFRGHNQEAAQSLLDKSPESFPLLRF